MWAFGLMPRRLRMADSKWSVSGATSTRISDSVGCDTSTASKSEAADVSRDGAKVVASWCARGPTSKI